MGECFFWYRLTQVVPDKFHRAVKRLCVCDKFCDAVCTEWLLYASDQLSTVRPPSLVGICAYWKHISTDGQMKYEQLSIVGKSALILSHGYAAPERRFTINSGLLTKERGPLSKSIVAFRLVKEPIRIFGACTDVPVTK